MPKEGLDKQHLRHYNKIKMFVRTKKQGNQVYHYLVESYREDGKVKQRVLRYLGKVAPSPGEQRQIIKEVEG